MKKIFALACMIVALATGARAQLVTSSPAILQESSQNVVITYHPAADGSNKELAGLDASTPVYAHAGVITNLSNNSWVYEPTWLDNQAKYKLEYAGPDTWTLNLGDMRAYFGITDPNEHIQRLAFVFRTATGDKQGKTQSGGDIFYDVHPEGFAMNLSADRKNLSISAPTDITFTVNTTAPASITLSVDGTTIATASGKTQLSATHNFSANGFYTVRATATDGTNSAESTLQVAYPKPSQAAVYPGGVPRMGAVRNTDGTVTFCIAAPGKESVILVPSWDGYQLSDRNIMNYQDYQGNRYFFTTVSGLDNTSWYPYYFLVDGITKVGDPYARLVLDPYSDKWLDPGIWPDMPQYPYDKFDDVVLAVYKGDFDTDFNFSDFKIPDHKSLTVYELLLRDFTGTEGKAEGNGTLNQAREKLWYLKSLGVNAIELLPVMEFNGNNSWGYNTNFYMALDKAYGSPADMKTFVEAAHQLGMAVILDIVFNQSDGLHPWYQMYGGTENNPFYNATAPHAYSVLNDWKQENVLVQQQWKDALQMWLKVYNVDGFRFDLVKGLGTSYNNGDTESYNASRVAVMKRLHDNIREVKPDAIHINENLAQPREENEMAADGQLNWSNINTNACQFAMGLASKSNLQYFDAASNSRTACSTVAYAESHDEERMAFRAKSGTATTVVRNSHEIQLKRLGMVAGQMLLAPGPKMIWQFGEMGADQTTKSGNGNNTDPKTVIWNYLDDVNRKGLHDTYQALCNLRTDNPELFDGSATFTATGNSDQLNTRSMHLVNGDKEILAFFNAKLQTTRNNVSISGTKYTAAANYRLICATPGFTPSLTFNGTTAGCMVPGHSFAVYASTATASVDDIISDGMEGANVTVTGGQGQINISGQYNSAEVYSISGVRQGSLNVAPGLYIVNVDGNVTKVIVR